MIGIICIVAYMMLMIFCSYKCKRQYNTLICDGEQNTKHKLKLIYVMIFSLLFTWLNVFCTVNSVSVGDDRLNYTYNFDGIRPAATVGLRSVIKVVKLFSNNVETLFYVTTFGCCVIMFWAYRNCAEADFRAILFLLSSNFVFFSFTGLKQIYAVAFSAMFFVFCMKGKSYKRNLLCAGTIVLACAFHTTGFILIPIFLIFLFLENRSKYIQVIILLMFVCAAFMEPILIFIGNSSAKIFPMLASKINEYFSSDTIHAGEGTGLAFFKGFPYYILFLWGILNRKRIKLKVENYDKYLILTAFGALSGLASIVSYWLSRLTAFFYFPMGVFYAIMMRYSSKNNRIIMSCLVIGSLLFFTLRSVALVFINYGGY